MSAHPLEPAVLKVFAEARDHKLSATALKAKLTGAKSSLHGADPAELDRALATLIDAGHLAVTGAPKDGPHPRPKGSYRLTAAGKDHVKPGKPDASDETLRYQESYILLQMLKFEERTASRSKLNEKLKSPSARGNLEFPAAAEDARATVDYHLHNLVRAGSLAEKRQGVSTIFTLTADGLKTLGAANQHETVEYRFVGSALNILLAAARDSSGKHHAKPTHHAEEHHRAPEPAQRSAAHQAADIEPKQIHAFVEQLKADRYAGKDLIPIHEVRSLVAQHHGADAAGHATFDELLMTMRADEEIKIIAIADSRDTPRSHLDDSIPGMNETLFFIDTK